MSKHIVLEEKVKEKLSEIEPSIGLLIGTVNRNENLVVLHVAPTYDELISDSSSPTSSSGDDDDEYFFRGLKKPPLQPLAVAAPSSVVNHCVQITRMLPGGLSVLGLFIVDDANIFKNNKLELSKFIANGLLRGLEKCALSKWGCAEFARADKDPVIVHYDGSSFKAATMKNRGNNISLLDLKFENVELKEVQVELDARAFMQLDGASWGLPLRKNLIGIVKEWKKILDTAAIFINLNANSETHVIVGKVPTILSDERGEYLNHLVCQGKLVALAYITADNDEAALAQNLKEDIMRTLISRMDLHCESLIDEVLSAAGTGDEADDQKIYHELPRRVFTKIPKRNLMVSDYLFPGEGPGDSIQSFHYVLGVLTNACDIDDQKEEAFDLDSLESSSESIFRATNTPEGISLSNPMKPRGTTIVGVSIALLIATIAILLPYLLKVY